MSRSYEVFSQKNDPQEFARYKKLSEMTFSALDYGTADSIIRHKVNEHKTTKVARVTFLEIDTYQKCQGSKEVAAANAWSELNSLRLTPVYPGGAEVFLAK